MLSMRLASFGLLAVALGYLIYDSLPVLRQGNAYATVVLSATLVLVLLQAALTAVRGRDDDVLPHLRTVLMTTTEQRLRLAGFVAAWIGYVLLLPPFGFAIATFLVLFASLVLAQRAGVLVSAVAAALFSLVFTVLVRTVFYIPVPESLVDRGVDEILYRLFH